MDRFYIRTASAESSSSLIATTAIMSQFLSRLQCAPKYIGNIIYITYNTLESYTYIVLTVKPLNTGHFRTLKFCPLFWGIHCSQVMIRYAYRIATSSVCFSRRWLLRDYNSVLLWFDFFRSLYRNSAVVAWKRF